MASKATPMKQAAAQFFTATHYAVAGASSVPSKFGYKIFSWYLTQNLSVIPLNPTVDSIVVEDQTFSTVSSPKKLQDPRNTSLSFVTPPKVTREVLREAKEVGVKGVWLQPGSFGEEEWEFARREWPESAVGGEAEGTVGHEGWCVLVDGEEALEGAAKLRGKGKRTSRL
ncbi:uncharacterized protein RCC_03930 [Ramularia collo-cygni]|uniref:CoA-binding domain-containing protein n=1 Tax=Ramularia collo-cygni TaxID=112498 RepID=A0A2D3UY27_9PEZI|nr:uncharacterized protein RCC_03930 [Ramularia collo-cygni]CZT18090.1 uncharacterized protein RCC_03930 [Ramularia collo-cygni]